MAAIAQQLTARAIPDPQPSPPPVPHPALVAKPVPPMADQITGRISTMMPAAPAVMKPASTQEWLDAIAAGQRKAVG